MGDLQRINGTHREEFGASEIQTTNEVGASSMAEREKAMVQAMYIMAMQRPRNMAIVRKKLLSDCQRPGFAEVARYRKPVGKKKNPATGEWEEQFAEGWSIRFAEAAMQHLGNLMLDERVVSEDADHIGMRYMVCDLESNVVKFSERRFSKTVERSSLKKGQAAISERTNSQGQTTYIVAATEDDLANKVGATRSKFHRTVVNFVPGDILDECMAQIRTTFDQMPAAEQIQRMIQAFAGLKVSSSDLEMYLGHSVLKCSKEEIHNLKEIFAAIKTGESTWLEFMDAKNPAGTEEAAKAAGEAKLAAMQQQQKPVEAAPAEEPQADVSDAAEPPVEQPEPAKRPAWGKK